MVTLKIDSNRPAAIWLLSDLHHGHVCHDAELFARHKELALKARARVLFLGDALEAVNTSSKVNALGGHFEQVGTIGDQRRAFEAAMKGLRVVSVIDGNHERRLVRESGESPLEIAAENIARQQKTPCHYSPHGHFVTVKVGKQTYRLAVHHGEGGPTTFFKHFQRDFPGADLYAGGHTHALSQEECFVHKPDGTMKRVVNVRTGSYLHMPTYAKDRPGTSGIPATGSWLLWLRPDRWEMKLESLESRSWESAA